MYNEQCAFNSFSVEQSVANNELLSSSAKENLESLLKEYGDVFPLDLPPRLPPTHNVQHGIDVMDGKSR